MGPSKHFLFYNIVSFLILGVHLREESTNWYSWSDETLSENDIRLLEVPHRIRRNALPSNNATAAPEIVTGNDTTKVTDPKTQIKTVAVSTSTPLAVSSEVIPTVTQKIPNVGVNGSGIRKDIVARVSDPIVSDESYNSTVKGETHLTAKVVPEVSEAVNPDQKLDNLTKTDHEYYTSTFIGQPDYFNELWANITNMTYAVHPILSSSHRRATTVSLNFYFPFYGQKLKNVTVATGGFIYTGEQVHNWLAATQYIAPLMANFDTRATNDSVVKIADDGHNFTVLWENVTLQSAVQNVNQSFTFSVTLREDGDIVFAYKDVPIPVQYIEDKDHPVKVGISDAYVKDRVVFLKRRKTIYEYHRINFLKHNITGGTVLILHPNPTCLLFTSCDTCINHANTNFNCTWCPAMERCSSGIDRKNQDWLLRNCDRNQISSLEECSALTNSSTANTGDTATSKKPINLHDIVATHDYTSDAQNKTVAGSSKQPLVSGKVAPTQSSMGGLIVVLMMLGLVGVGSGWVFYAYKNPHTRSGQLLIKYRPSTWNWKRGEARYTAATIHM